jgi:hypothetical protein
MSISYPPRRLWLVAAAALLAGACQQADQVLPFDLDPTQGAIRTIGASGGTISVPPTVSLDRSR